MRIATSTIALASQRDYIQRLTKSESLRVWVGSGRATFAQSLETAMFTRSLNAEDYSMPRTQLPSSLTARDNGSGSATNDVTSGTSDPRFSMAALRGGSLEPISAIGRASSGAVGRMRSARHTDHAHPKSQEVTEADQGDCLDARWRAIKLLVEKLMGGKCNLKQINQANQPCANSNASATEGEANTTNRFGWGLEYNASVTKYEAEQTSYAAQGTITTSDGRSIEISLSVAMIRESTQQASLSIKAGDATIDPLMISFDGSSVELTNTRYAFDLNADGRNENIPFAQTGNAFLALDVNDDGTINSGQELFGPTSGNGFAELAAYDQDHNNWIDENDAVYADLRLWSKDSQGNDVLETLKERQVGALYLGNAAAPFTLGASQGSSLGQVVASGLYLSEQGAAGALQQVNLSA